MVTSDEERQGVTGPEETPGAAPLVMATSEGDSDPRAEPVQLAETPETQDGETGHSRAVPDGESRPAETEAAEKVATPDIAPPAVAHDPKPLTPEAATSQEEPELAEEPDRVVSETHPSTEVEPPQPPVADPAAGAELSEDEATGRRVESLLAETPDSDPQTPQPARGEPTADNDPGGDVIAPLTFDAPPAAFDVAADDIPPMPRASAPFREGLRRNGMDRVGPIVAFDFDGTLTVRDSFTAFLKWREGSGRYHAEMAALAPAALKYLFDRDPGKLKAAAVRRFLQGLPRDVLNAEAMEFAAVSAPLLFRPDALRAWRRFRADGARLVIVTASPENIVAPFARGLGCDLLIATQLLFDPNDRVQGGLLGDNCRGAEKARRIRQALGQDVVLAAAYGDTDGDWEMLEMAEQQFMRLFVGTPGKPEGKG